MRLAVLSLACLGALAITPAYAQQGDAGMRRHCGVRSPQCARRWKACSNGWTGWSSAMLCLRRQQPCLKRGRLPPLPLPM